MLKKRERQMSQELSYTKEKLDKLSQKHHQLLAKSEKSLPGKQQSNYSSGVNTQHIVLNNRELVRVIEDKSILERQVDEYKSALKDQTQLIQSLQHLLRKKHHQSMEESLCVTTNEDELQQQHPSRIVSGEGRLINNPGLYMLNTSQEKENNFHSFNTNKCKVKQGKSGELLQEIE